jgi:3-keto-L-gulonate-6-phosphate decarboxylase
MGDQNQSDTDFSELMDNATKGAGAMLVFAKTMQAGLYTVSMDDDDGAPQACVIATTDPEIAQLLKTIADEYNDE